jgi:hypothetical protein
METWHEKTCGERDILRGFGFIYIHFSDRIGRSQQRAAMQPISGC